MHPTPAVRQIFLGIDGHRSWRQIFDGVRQQIDLGMTPRAADEPDDIDRHLFAAFYPWYEALNSIERLLLRRGRSDGHLHAATAQ